MNNMMVLKAKCLMYNEKNIFLTVSWLSGLLSAEIFISTGECGVQMPPLTSENSHFLRSGPQEATLVMNKRSELCPSLLFVIFSEEYCEKSLIRPDVKLDQRQWI